jgi:ferrous iron transport protein B
MSCSARLPVYGLLIGTFFAASSPLVQGGLMLGCYALGIVVAAVIARSVSLFFGRAATTPFILEMPTYKLPQVSAVARQVWDNTASFLGRAGTTIFCLCILLWALAFFPHLPAERATAIRNQAVAALPADADAAARQTAGEHAVASAALEHSLAGRLGHALEPVLAPLGYDWKMGVGLVGSFAAREVFVSTLGILYGVGEAWNNDVPLQDELRADHHPDGRPVWTPLVAVSLMVWFVLAMQCISTFAVVRRESGGWRWPIIQLVGMNLLAYVAALATYQVGLWLTR